MPGGSTYALKMTVAGIPGDSFDDKDNDGEKDDGEDYFTRGGVVFSRIPCNETTDVHLPSPPEVSLAPLTDGDVACPNPMAAILGEPLHAMVSNLGEAAAESEPPAVASKNGQTLSQFFETGPNPSDYRLQGVGIVIDGSVADVPDGPESVAVALYRDGAKQFDLVSPAAYKAGSCTSSRRPRARCWSRTRSTAWPGLTSAARSTTGLDLERRRRRGRAGGLLDLEHRARPRPGQLQRTQRELVGDGGLRRADRAARGGRPGRGSAGDAEVAALAGGAYEGYRFRVAFVTFIDADTPDAGSGEIADYNAFVQRQAAERYNDRIIQALAPEFRALVCTETVDARSNAGMSDGRRRAGALAGRRLGRAADADRGEQRAVLPRHDRSAQGLGRADPLAGPDHAHPAHERLAGGRV